MDLLPRSFGERVWFRLSDVPIDKRLKAAERVRDELARTGLDDPLRAIDEAREIERIAENPSDIVRTVSLKAWVKAMGAPP
jgi:hypothetical protein